MIIQENDFLRTYNEMTSLWEDVGPDTEYFFDDVASNAITDAAIIEKLNKAEGSYTDEKIDIDYWCKLKQLLEDKAYSFGRISTLAWYARFLSFYNAYKAERAILAKFREDPKLRSVFKSCKFPNEEDQAKLRPDTNNAAPDIDSEVGGIECKQYGSTSSVHGAKFVVRHTAVKLTDTQCEIRAWLVGSKEDLKAVFGNLRLPTYAYILEPTRRLDTGLDRIPKATPLVCTVENIHADVVKALAAINNYLNSHDTVKVQTATQIVNKQTKVIDDTIEKLGGDAPTKTVAETNIESAVQNLKASADILQNTVTSSSR